MSAVSIYDEIAATGVALLLREPFYAHMLSGLNKQVVGPGHAVDTLAVGLGPGGLALYVNEQFWKRELIRPEHRMGVLKHEMLHLVFRHLFVMEPRLDALLLNIAFDLVVNQYIERGQLPEDSIFLDSFPELRLEAGQTWYYYYQKLEDLRDNRGDDHKGSASEEALEKIRSDSHGMERHQPWMEVRSKTEIEKTILEDHLESALRTAHARTNAHAWGAMPGAVREKITQSVRRGSALADWGRILRIFTESASKTRLKNTIRRPSKRYGTTPGIRIRRRRHLHIAIDTSGSIGQEEMALFFHEIFHLWRSGCSIDISECDVKITQTYPYRGVTPEFVQGRGGTRFDEPLERANRERPDGLIYFTDGFADRPQVKPLVPVLWVLTPKGLEPSSAAWRELPGRKVKL